MYVHGRVASLKRGNVSTMGNPSYIVTLEGNVEYRTQSNASIAYAIDHCLVGKHVGLFLTRSGRVFDIVPHATV